MPDNVNGMQANIGLSGAQMSPVGMPTPSPADVALRLTTEASQRMQYSQQAIASAPLGASAIFQRQFQQQMATIQAQQSMNPYAAAMMAQSMTPQQQRYMPSPLTMTPPSTGVFRTPPPPAVAPIAPAHVPDSPITPFTPRAPAPMFSSPYEQQIQQQEIRANRNFSYASQAPSVVGQGLGIAGGAYAGAQLGKSFGGMGALAGAGIGAVAAGASGFAQGAGNLAQRFMRPAIERREMGAGLQSMSRDWVVSGQDMSPLGRGLSRDASINLAGGIQDLAGNKQFQQQTGGMFNRKDLMQMTRQGGEQGLFDMAQSVPQIKQQLQQTAQTVKQFMELTNDPDVSNVIRQMGRMRQFGLSQQEMVTAAQGMKTYARAAGTSIGGVQQIGGLPGAATFQQAGLTAGQGFQYGNFAAASARQSVASGAVSPRQLALMGGVQGMAQRDIQAQAAFSSMPLFAASNAQFGAQGWGVNQRASGRAEGGAFGMVNNAMQAMNQGVQRGGLGALAMFPLQQREIADRAMSEMTPMQLKAQRFEMAMNTGQRLGMSGQGGFAAGARTLYGDEVASQMMTQAKSPEFWRAQKQMLRGRQRELGYNTMRRAEEASPMLGGVPRDAARALGFTGRGSWGSGVERFFGEEGDGIGGAVSGAFEGLGEMWDQHQAGKSGIIRTRTSRANAAATAGVASAKGLDAFQRGARRAADEENLVSGDIDIDSGGLVKAANLQDQGVTGLGEQIANVATAPLRYFTGTDAFKPGEAVQYGRIALSTSKDEQRQMVRKYVDTASRSLEILDESKKVGGVKKHVVDAVMSVEGALGESGKGQGMSIIADAANILDKEVYSRGSGGETLSEADYDNAVKKSLMNKGGLSSSEATAKVKEMRQSGALGKVISQAVHHAKKNPRDPDLWIGTQEKKNREGVRELISEATESRADNLRDSMETLEGTLGIAADSLFGNYSKQERDIQKEAAKVGGKAFALQAAAAQAFTGDMEDRDDTKWKELSKKFGLSAAEQNEYMTKAEGMSAPMADRMAGIAGKGTSDQLMEYGDKQHAIGMQKVWGGEGFQKAVGKYSDKLEGMLAGDEQEITAKKVAGAFTSEELEKMSSTGGTGGKRMAALIKASQGTGAKAEKAQALLAKQAAEMNTITEEGVEESSAVKGEGKEAQKLAASEDAMENMQQMFAGFGPATKEFALGAKELREAMQSDMFTRMQDGE